MNMTCSGFRWPMPPRSALALALLALPLSAAAAPTEPPADDCATISACLGRLIAIGTRESAYPVERKLHGFGDAAVDALIPLLRNGDGGTRAVAGMTLAGFERIDPRHLPALIAAYEGRGGFTANGWLPRAIAATGTGEALAYLQARFLEKPDFGSNSQIHMALLKFGGRVRPFVLAQLEACRTGAAAELCRGALAIPTAMGGTLPDWAVPATLALAGAPAADPEVRRIGEDFAIQRRHPIGLPVLRSRLEAASSSIPDPWELEHTIGEIGDYGIAAVDLGPLVLPLLASNRPDIRAEAALTLGLIGARTGSAGLIALEPAFEDDWLLAYNVAESLGRLHARQARPLLERLARDHWHRGVRNNAERALAMIDGGAFARPDEPGDGQPYPSPKDEQGEEYHYFGDLRFAGDEPPDCESGDGDPTVALDQDPVATIRWPRHGMTKLEVSAVDEATEPEIRQRIPVQQVQGSVVAMSPTRAGRLVAFDGGEFGGGLYHLEDGGPATALLAEPVHAAWRMGGRLYVAAGLAHLTLDHGHLYVVDPRRLTVERAVRLPASPRRLSVSSRRAVIVETAEGSVAVGEHGRLVAPESIADCATD